MAGHFEAKKHAYRQTQDGIVIAFVMHPDDVSQAMAMAPLGTRFMIGFEEIGDDEQPIEQSQPSSIVIAARKEKRRFDEMSAAQQAGMLCLDANFYDFLARHHRDDWIAADDGTATIASDTAARVVRKLCGVKSRADIPNSPVSLERWQTLLSRYRQWETENAYGDQVR